ncbi:meiotically up-regulated gene 113-domain-containing protein [Usnea florida]
MDQLLDIHTRIEGLTSMITQLENSPFAQARDHGPSKHRADQLLQSHSKFETPKSRHTASDSAPRTPDSRGLKRKGSDLTPSSKIGVPKSGGSGACSTELFNLSLGGPPPSFNLGFSPEMKSPSGAAGQTRSTNDPYLTNDYADRQHRAQGTLAQDSNGSPSHSNRPAIRKLAPYAKRPPGPLALEMLMCEAIIKPLNKLEMGVAWRQSSSETWIQQTTHKGWIYIYQLANEVNTVKIGITQSSIEGRLDGWMEQCGHKPQIVYPTTESEREPVPNIYRLETLVHTEFAFNRLEEVGCSCEKTEKHIEWFDVAVAHAREVVVKWSTWMRNNPYKEVAPNNWHLSPQHIPNLAKLSRPSPRISVVEGSATKPIRI